MYVSLIFSDPGLHFTILATIERQLSHFGPADWSVAVTVIECGGQEYRLFNGRIKCL